MRRWWIALGVGGALVIALVIPAARRSFRAGVARTDEALAIAKVEAPAPVTSAPSPPPVLAGLDLTKIAVGEGGATAPLPEKRTARLTIDPALQRVADGIMALHHLPEAAVVLMDVATGHVLVYASHVEKGPARDLAVEATAPAASVFKIVTGASLVENAGLTPDHRECYSGGEQRIQQQDLVPDPRRDRWCASLAGAMGRSLNTVFARLALRSLKPAVLEETAKSLGFGASLAFDVPVQPSALRFPEDSLGYARTAAGFWNTTLSPLHAAWLSATVARGGEPVRPVLVSEVVDAAGTTVWTAPAAPAYRRALKPETAEALTTMMESTVKDGTSYRAFHDGHGTSFLPGVQVAGKTGTLTDATTQRFYTWFTGFAPSHLEVDDKTGAEDAGVVPPPLGRVAIGVLVVNQPTWTIKANVLAREVLRAYYASQKTPGVTPPQLRPAVAAGKKRERKRT